MNYKNEFYRDGDFKLRLFLRAFKRWLRDHYYYTIGDRSIKFRSVDNYEKYMISAIKHLGILKKDYYVLCKPGLLKTLKAKLKSMERFQERDAKYRSDIESAFNAFIKFQQWNAAR